MEDQDLLSREITEKLRAARMTAEDLALAASLARDTVGRWIRSSTVPRLDSLQKVEGVLGRRLGYVVDLSAAVADRKDRAERRRASGGDHRLQAVQPGQSAEEWDAVPPEAGTVIGGDAAPGRRPPGGYPGAGEAKDLEARVHRAVVHLPYIRRDVEDEVRARLVSGQPVLLVGSSMVGKTRMAATLIKEMFATRQVLIPDTKDALVSLDSPAIAPRDCVIFLDDIERLIGAEGITQSALHNLGARNVIIGTVRALVYDGYQPTDRLRPFEWDVLSVFERVFVLRNLSLAEQGRLLEAVEDTAVRERILRTGVGEYVGAAERISEALRLGPSVSPVGLAVVQGAADWARAGMSTPTPASLLPVLAAPHLDHGSRLGLTGKQEFRAGLRWATRAINPTVSLLQREQHDAFSVFDYALDLISGQGEPIPETTWPILIEHASPADLMNIGRTAAAAALPRIAEQAWRRTEETGDSKTAPMAALFLGAQLREQGDLEGARAAYGRAIASGHSDAAPGALFNLGNLLKQQGDLEGAEDAYQRAIEYRHPGLTATAALNLGRLRARQGDMTGAREAYQRAIDSDLDMRKLETDLRTRLAARADAQTRPVHVEVIDLRRWRADPEAVAAAALNLGELLAEQGDVNGARTAFTRAIDSGDADIGPKAAASLGTMLHQGGDVEGARTAYQAAAEAGHPEASPLAAFNLGILLAENGDVDGALNGYQRAAAFGNAEISKAAMRRMLQLGILMAEQGDLDGARTAYQRAVDFGRADMAPWPMMKLAMALYEHGDTDTAKAALQSAVDSGHPPVVAVAWLVLGNLLAGHGDAEAARAALQHAVDSEYPEVVAVASLGLGWLLADRGDVDAARAAFQRAVQSENAKIAEEAARNLQALQ